MVNAQGPIKAGSRFLPFLSLAAIALSVLISRPARGQDYFQVYQLGVGYTDTFVVTPLYNSSDFGWVDPYSWAWEAPYSPVVADPLIDAGHATRDLYGAPRCLPWLWWLP